MSARPQRGARTRPQVLNHHVDSIEAADRLTDQMADIANRMAANPRASFTVSLAIGDNRINHGLGVRPSGASVMPTVADATFGWAVTSRDARQIVITVVGVAQPYAEVEVWV